MLSQFNFRLTKDRNKRILRKEIKMEATRLKLGLEIYKKEAALFRQPAVIPYKLKVKMNCCSC